MTYKCISLVTLNVTKNVLFFQGMPAHLKKPEEFPRYTQKLEIKVILYMLICASSQYFGILK